jgi:MFS family permease
MLTGIKAKMHGRRMYQLMSLCCSLVSYPYSLTKQITHRLQSFCLYGYDAGVLGGVQNTKPFLSALGNPTGTYVIPMVASSYVLAATVCSVGVMFFGMQLGRRMCIILGNCCVIVGTAIQASAMGVPHIIVGRVICGFGIGFISSTSPTYMVSSCQLRHLESNTDKVTQAEMSIEAKERGPEVARQCSWLIFGIAIAYWIDFGFTRFDSQISWVCF